MQELFDFVFIQKHIDNSKFRDFLIKYNIIKSTTKQIYARSFRYNFSPITRIYAKNGRGTVIFDITVNDDELPELFKQLS